MLGSSLLFAIAYVVAAARYPGNEFVDSLGLMGFPAALLISMPFTYLTKHTRTAQAVIVVACLAVLVLAAFVATLI